MCSCTIQSSPYHRQKQDLQELTHPETRVWEQNLLTPFCNLLPQTQGPVCLLPQASMHIASPEFCPSSNAREPHVTQQVPHSPLCT